MVAEISVGAADVQLPRSRRAELKGIATPVSVCEVVYERKDPAALLNRTPFVGRTEQLEATCRPGSRKYCNGHGSIAMLRGEPGIGKTRTLEEFSDLRPPARRDRSTRSLLRRRMATTLWSLCRGHQRVRAQRTRGVRGRFRNARGNPRAHRAGTARHAGRCSASRPALDKEEERFRLFDAVSQFLIAISDKRRWYWCLMTCIGPIAARWRC